MVIVKAIDHDMIVITFFDILPIKSRAGQWYSRVIYVGACVVKPGHLHFLWAQQGWEESNSTDRKNGVLAASMRARGTRSHTVWAVANEKLD